MTKGKSCWVWMLYFQVQDKDLSLGYRKMQSARFNWCSIGVWSNESHRSAKIGKRKKPITWSFQAQIAILFIYLFFFITVFKGHYNLTLGGVFSEKRVHRMPPIVDKGFLYPKLSQIFYRCFFFKKLKIRYCRSCITSH